MGGIEDWWAAGERLELRLRGRPRTIFVRRLGAGPLLTLLHGFPSSSHDWWKVAPALARDRALLLLDFLGFGASDKPREHEYSIHEQADLVEAVWERDGVASTAIVAHDYAVTVAQELLARRAGGTLRVDLRSVHLLNGGLYPDLHRPVAAQTALLDPDLGPQLSAQLTEAGLAEVLRPTFGEKADVEALSRDIWLAVSRGGVIMDRLIHYMVDRHRHERRWVNALEGTDVPLAFIWGMLDPISGAHVAERIRERLPAAPLRALEDIGHWPALEAPELVLAALQARS